MHRSVSALCALVLLLGAPLAGAQAIPEPPDPERVRVRVGALWLDPTFAVANAGRDSNVLNQADEHDPRGDFTITLTPSTNMWLRAGPTWIVGNVREDFVWFRQNAGERSANSDIKAGWLVPLNRLTLYAGGNWIRTRERPGFEIDARADRSEQAANGAAEVRVLSRTLLGVRGERRHIDFAQGTRFLGSDLRTSLNRVQTTGAATVRHELTPLTSLTVEGGIEQDRFEFSPIRDADSTQLSVGVRFDPFALIRGSAQIGYRDFNPLAPQVPGYRGSTALVSLSYVALGSTRLTVQASRDVEYSFELTQPYYVETGVYASLGQQIYGPLDVEGRFRREQLVYTAQEGIAVEVPGRRDEVKSFGGGAGYRVGADLRLGFNVDWVARESRAALRRYEGLRYGLALTYGL